MDLRRLLLDDALMRQAASGRCAAPMGGAQNSFHWVSQVPRILCQNGLNLTFNVGLKGSANVYLFSADLIVHESSQSLVRDMQHDKFDVQKLTI